MKAFTVICQLVGLGLVLLLAACDSGESALDTEANTTTVSTTTPVSTSVATTTSVLPTTVAPVTTVVPSTSSTVSQTTPVPTTAPDTGITQSTIGTPPTTTADEALYDWTAIATGLEEKLNTLTDDPDLADIQEVCLADSLCEERRTLIVQSLIGQGLHSEGGPELSVQRVNFIGSPYGIPVEDALEVIVDVEVRFDAVTPPRLVDDNGVVHQEFPTLNEVGDTLTSRYLLGRATTESEWLVKDDFYEG